MKRRMRNRTYGVVGGDGLYPVTYPIIFFNVMEAAEALFFYLIH